MKCQKSPLIWAVICVSSGNIGGWERGRISVRFVELRDVVMAAFVEKATDHSLRIGPGYTAATHSSVDPWSVLSLSAVFRICMQTLNPSTLGRL